MNDKEEQVIRVIEELTRDFARSNGLGDKIKEERMDEAECQRRIDFALEHQCESCSKRSPAGFWVVLATLLFAVLVAANVVGTSLSGWLFGK